MFTVASCTDGPGIEQISLTHFTRTLCDKFVECGCAPLIGPEIPPSCDLWNLEPVLITGADDRGDYGDYGYEDNDEAGDLSIQFDRACADRLADLIAQTPCDAEEPLLRCNEYCKLYFGTRWEGEPCQSEEECAQGLVCVAAECRDPCKVTVAGEGESCEFSACAEGLECVELENPDGPPVSVCLAPGGGALAGVGQPCMGHFECVTQYCPAGFCEELPRGGQPCGLDGRCADDAVCVDATDESPGTCAAFSPVCGLALIAFVGYDVDDDYYY